MEEVRKHPDVSENTIAFKVLVVGEPSVGKTSFARRYATGTFTDQYKSTIGVDFVSKLIQWDENTQININMWDLAGQERLNTQSRVYYREAHGALCVYDAARPDTLKQVDAWKKTIDERTVDREGIQTLPPCILIANKMDLLRTNLDGKDEETQTNGKLTKEACDRVQPSIAEVGKFMGFVASVPVSTLENVGLDDAMKILIAEMMKRRPIFKEELHQDVVILDAPPQGKYSALTRAGYCYRC